LRRRRKQEHQRDGRTPQAEIDEAFLPDLLKPNKTLSSTAPHIDKHHKRRSTRFAFTRRFSSRQEAEDRNWDIGVPID
jgi:hypothetical protein